jgi:TPR repeat protein
MRFSGRSFRFFLPVLLILSITVPAMAAKDDWQSDFHKWTVSSQSDPNCKVRYTTGIYRPDLGDTPVWGMMTEKMFKWFSKDGVKLAPSICPSTRATQDKAEYRILISVSPMKTISHTARGSETRTSVEPFSANVNYSDGSTATIQGQQTSTVVVPTETTISRSSVAWYMYTYRVRGDQLELIGTDNVVYSRVAVRGSGEAETDAAIIGGLGNHIRAFGDRHRENKLYEAALKAVRADASELRGDIQATVSSGAAVVRLPKLTVEEVAKKAEQGDATAQFVLGGMYHDGRGAAKDEAEALRWWRKAAEQGFVAAQFSLGLNYASGKGIAKDEAEAVRWFRKAAEQGEVNSQYNLGLNYASGEGIAKDEAEAVRWFRKAAEQGDADAQLLLGLMCAEGRGVAENHADAVRWYRKAAEQGDADAQHNLGKAYAEGRGIPKDETEAYFWLNLGASTLDETARTLRDRVGEHLPPEKRLEVQERCRKFAEAHPQKTTQAFQPPNEK